MISPKTCLGGMLSKKNSEKLQTGKNFGKHEHQSGLVLTVGFPARIWFLCGLAEPPKFLFNGSLNAYINSAWINEQRGGLTKGKDFYHIAVSNNFRDQKKAFGGVFR